MDVKQHFTEPTEQIISTTPVLRRLCEQFSIYLLLTNYLDDTGFTPSLWTVFDTPFTEQIISTSVLRRLCEQFLIYLLLNKLSRRHQFYAVFVDSFRYTFYGTNYLDDTSFTPSVWTVFDIPFTEQIISTTPILRRLGEQFSNSYRG